MRMWMVHPKILCRQHLLGEHSEIHKHRHNFVKGHSFLGRIEGNAIEPASMGARHDRLVLEMKARGYNHKSPYVQPDLSGYDEELVNVKVDVFENVRLLINRCPECKKRWILRLSGKLE